MAAGKEAAFTPSHPDGAGFPESQPCVTTDRRGFVYTVDLQGPLPEGEMCYRKAFSVWRTPDSIHGYHGPTQFCLNGEGSLLRPWTTGTCPALM